MDKYVCSVCHWIYEPERNNNIDFINLDENFSCPVCGASKRFFDKEKSQ